MATTGSISEQTGIRSYEEFVSTRKAKTELGKDDFLQLLAAQLQYQNPLEPMSDTAFVAQLAQFSSLQQMEALTTTMTTYQYYNLAGKYVYAEVRMDTGEDEVVHGTVDRIIMKDGKAFAQVGEFLIDCTKISQVWDKDLFGGNTALLENTNLIGKYVRANYYENGKLKEVVNGQCTRVAIEDNLLVAYLDSGHKVGIGDIIDVSDQPIVTGTTEEKKGAEGADGADTTNPDNTDTGEETEVTPGE